jgi:serine protease Do
LAGGQHHARDGAADDGQGLDRAAGGIALRAARDLAKQIGAMAPGATAKLTVWRMNEEKSVSLTLAELPKEREARGSALDSGQTGTDVPKLGLTLAPAEQVAGSGPEGVVVTKVDPNGLASEHGFKTGDVILDVSGKKVATSAEVRNAIGAAQKMASAPCCCG